ncbi:selenoprotein K [Fagus crenata]
MCGLCTRTNVQLFLWGLHDPLCGTYTCSGVVKSKRSIWKLRTITDFFWAIVNYIGVFFATMFSMEKSDAYRKGSGASKKWDGGGPGGPGGGPYGGGPRGPPRGLDNVPYRHVAHAVAEYQSYLVCIFHIFSQMVCSEMSRRVIWLC